MKLVIAISSFLALSVGAAMAWSDQTFFVGPGIRPSIIFCIENDCTHIEPAKARQLAALLIAVAEEQEKKN